MDLLLYLLKILFVIRPRLLCAGSGRQARQRDWQHGGDIKPPVAGYALIGIEDLLVIDLVLNRAVLGHEAHAGPTLKIQSLEPGVQKLRSVKNWQKRHLVRCPYL